MASVIRQGLILGRVPRAVLKNSLRKTSTAANVPELSASLSPQETESLHTLYDRLTKSNTHIMLMFEKAIRPLDAEDQTRVCVKILEQIQDHGSNRRLLETVLAHVGTKDLSRAAINNLADLAPKIDKSYKSILPEVQAKYAQIFKEHGNDQLIARLMSSIDTNDRKLLTTHILVIMLLKSNRLQNAADIVFKSLKTSTQLSPITIELLTFHLCETNDTDDIKQARLILGLSKDQAYPIQPRTLSNFLTKAVQLNDYETCYNVQSNIRDRTFVDNGTLVRLAESLVHKGAYQMVRGIELYSKRKRSFPPEFRKRLAIASVESVANKEGFNKAWSRLKKNYKGQQLSVVDYPYLVKSCEVPQGQDELSSFIDQQMNIENEELKRFILSLFVKRICGSGEIRRVLVILRRSTLLQPYISENVILQLINGALVAESSTLLKDILDLVEHMGMMFREKKTVNLFIGSLMDTDYSYYIPKVLDLVEIENFTLRPDIYEQLQNSYSKSEKSLDHIAKYQPLR